MRKSRGHLGWAVVWVLLIAPAVQAESARLRTWGRTSSVMVDRSLNVTVWNIQKANGGIEWASAFSPLVVKTDLILAQEGWTNRIFRKTLEQFPDVHWIFARSFGPPGLETGVFVGTKFAVTDIQAHVSPGREPVTFTHKMASSMILPIKDGRRLLVLNIHSLNFVEDPFFEQQLVPLFRLIESHRGPVLFAGDFNTWSSRRQDYLAEGMKRLEMSQVIFSNDPREHKVDHIFYRGIQVQWAEIRPEINTSDHWPLTANFLL